MIRIATYKNEDTAAFVSRMIRLAVGKRARIEIVHSQNAHDVVAKIKDQTLTALDLEAIATNMWKTWLRLRGIELVTVVKEA